MPKLKQYFHIFLMVSGFSLFGISSAAEAQPTVTFTAIDGSAAEAGQETAGFSVTRTDDGNTAAILRVYVQTGGTAAIGSDYSTTNMGYVEPNVYFIDIRANDLSTSAILTPIRDNLIEDEEDITITLLGPRGVGNDYTVGTPSEAGATISDDVAEVILTLDDGEAAEAGQNTAGFTVTRSSQGNTAAILRVYVQTGGTATIGSDYSTTNMGLLNPTSISLTYGPMTCPRALS